VFGPVIRFTNTAEKYYKPYVGTEYSAGADLKAAQSYIIDPGQMVKVDTGIAVEIPEQYFGMIVARSGTATKKGLRLANCSAIIDADYRGELIIPLYNDSSETQTIEEGERIAQLIIIPFVAARYVYAESLSETERGAGGFGSTGTS
jgi:dUTP pyrophosphatase